MISKWLNHGGLGQMLAPDPSMVDREEEEEGVSYSSRMWDILAPDPNYVSEDTGTTRNMHENDHDTDSKIYDNADKNVHDINKDATDKNIVPMVQCMHCHKMTPCNKELISSQPLVPSTSTLSSTSQVVPHHDNSGMTTPNQNVFQTPTRQINSPPYLHKIVNIGANSTNDNNNHDIVDHPNNHLNAAATAAATNPNYRSDVLSPLERQVLDAAKELAESIGSPTPVWEKVKNFHGLCASGTTRQPLSEKQLRKVRRLLKANPKLARARCSRMGDLAPDGYNSLHICAHAGNYQVALLLLDLDAKEYLESVKRMELLASNDKRRIRMNMHPHAPLVDARDVQGRTALHIASERGHISLVRLLRDAMTNNIGTTSNANDDNDVNIPPIDRNDDNSNLSSPHSTIITTTTSTSTPHTNITTSNTTITPIRQQSHHSNSTSRPHPPTGRYAPKDLTGRTPLGLAATSTEVGARKHRSELYGELFEKGDPSICGEYTPAKDRAGNPNTNIMKMTSTNKHKNMDNNSNTILLSPSSNIPNNDHNNDNHNQTNHHPPLYFTDTIPNNHILGDIHPPNLLFGYSEMPGMRIEMEDAMCHAYPILPPKLIPTEESTSISTTIANNNNKTPQSSSSSLSSIGFFAVFDGHGDGGIVSNYLANNIIPRFQETESWKQYDGSNVHALVTALTKACAIIDQDLRTSQSSHASSSSSAFLDHSRNGGSTGIMAIVTHHYIMVANVGDSRCILVQKQLTENDNDIKTLETNLSQLEIVTVKEDDETTTSTTNASSVTLKNDDNPMDPQDSNTDKTSDSSKNDMNHDNTDIKVLPLSKDHKPDLPQEKERIEKAGLQVKGETFEENGVTNTIHKIWKSDTERIAVSRAFGDFDYKSNPDVAMDSQAIISTPEIVVHKRDPSKDMYLILACDGVYDVMSNDEVGTFVKEKADELHFKKEGSTQVQEEMDVNEEYSPVLPKVGDALLDECLERKSTDNMSVMIVALPTSTQSEEYDTGKTTTDGSGARALTFTDE